MDKEEDEDYMDEESRLRRRMRTRKIIMWIIVGLFVFTILSGFIPGLSLRDWEGVDPDRLRVECKVESVEGKQEFVKDGSLHLHGARFDLHLWASIINTTRVCHEFLHPSNSRHFTYLSYYLNLTQSDIEKLVSEEKLRLSTELIKPVTYYYYEDAWELDRGPGKGRNLWRRTDRHGLTRERIDCNDSYFCDADSHAIVLMIRFSIAYGIVFLIVFVKWGMDELRERYSNSQ